MILCAKCQKNEAIMTLAYGPVWCQDCQNSDQGQRLTGTLHEFTTDNIREGRKKYRKELLQPYRQGEFSKEYRDAYPEIAKDMVKEGVITQRQFDKAKEVWRGDEIR